MTEPDPFDERWPDTASPRDHDEEARQRFFDHLFRVLLLLFLIWTVKIVEVAADISLVPWGLRPRETWGLIGILTMPFLHSDFPHLHANSFGVLSLGLALFHFYRKVAWRVIVYSWLWGGLLVWLFARGSVHVGASGVIYGLSAFLFLSGILRRDRGSLGASLIVALLFGGSIWGIFPFQRGISWEGHLFGALVGSYLAFLYRYVDLPPRYIEDDEPWTYHGDDRGATD